MQRTHKEGKQLGYHEHCSEGLTWMSIDYTNIILRFRCEILISFVSCNDLAVLLLYKNEINCLLSCQMSFEVWFSTGKP